jgi:glutathione peroxidase
MHAAPGGTTITTLQQIPLSTITGETTSLADHAGSVLLIVNVASKCGLTPQYTGLEALYEQRRAEGFAVLGFPANNFGAQEPGTNEEISEFCSSTYSVEFPLFSKISVVGDDQHPLYHELTTAIPRAEGDPDAFRDRLRGFGMTPNEDPDVLWNFEKFLVARDGSVVRRFAPTMAPDDPVIVAAIDAELAR